MDALDAVESVEPKRKRSRFSMQVIVLFVLALLLLLPIWSVQFPPLLDYPNHLARAFVLGHLHDPAFTFNKFYRADWGAYPYLGMDASLAALGHFFSIENAGRIFLSVCVLALPAASWFFLREANPGQSIAALWSLLIAVNVFFLEGFLNFDLSIALGFFALGLWLRWLANPDMMRWAATLVAFTALYFAHLVGFAIFGLIVIAYLAFARRAIRDWLWTGALAVPGVVFYLRYSRLGLSLHDIVFHGFSDKLDSLGLIMHGYSPMLDWICLAALGVWFLAAWWNNSEFRWNFRWVGIAVVLFILFWIIPWMWGDGSDLDIRVLPPLFVVLLATVRTGRRAKQLAWIPILVFAARTVMMTQHFVAVQPQLAGLARSFDYVPHGALVLPIVEGDQDPIERPFTHFWAYGVIRRGWFSAYLMDVPGQTPLRIVHDSYTPEGFWTQPYEDAPDWNQVRSDYDYVWAYDVAKFSPGLADIGDKVYEYGALEVYRVRKLRADTAPKITH